MKQTINKNMIITKDNFEDKYEEVRQYLARLLIKNKVLIIPYTYLGVNKDEYIDSYLGPIWERILEELNKGTVLTSSYLYNICLSVTSRFKKKNASPEYHLKNNLNRRINKLTKENLTEDESKELNELKEELKEVEAKLKKQEEDGYSKVSITNFSSFDIRDEAFNIEEIMVNKDLEDANEILAKKEEYKFKEDLIKHIISTSPHILTLFEKEKKREVLKKGNKISITKKSQQVTEYCKEYIEQNKQWSPQNKEYYLSFFN